MNKIDPQNTILIAAGGTGGHIFPSLSIINEIKVGNTNNQNQRGIPRNLDQSLILNTQPHF